MNEAVQNAANELAGAIDRAAAAMENRAMLLKAHAKRIRGHATQSSEFAGSLLTEGYVAAGLMATELGRHHAPAPVV